MGKLCERCKAVVTVNKNRYCSECKKQVIQELKDAGYLSAYIPRKQYRSSDQQELTRETKYGVDR